MASKLASKQVVTGLEEVPVTLAHPPPRSLDEHIANPGVARATEAADKEHPDGYQPSPPIQSRRYTSLQQHFEYFDYDGDGTIYPWESFKTMRYLGWGPEPINSIVSAMGTMLFHFGLSYFTQDSWIPDPLLRIHISKAHRTKHGSTTKSWDHEGRFIPQKFEEVFSKYDKDNKGGLYLTEIFEMLRGQRNLFDFAGRKEDARGQFDGTAYYRRAERNGHKHYGPEARVRKLSKAAA